MNKNKDKEIKELKLYIKELNQEINELHIDREKYRAHFIRRFRWWIKLQSEGSTPNLAWLIEDDAKQLRNFKWFSFL